MNWQELKSTEQLEIIRTSSNNPNILGILIFKHSTRCATSALAVNRLDRNWNYKDTELPTYFLDLLNFRSVSDEIVSMFGIHHESPQILIIKGGSCIYSDSHNGISVRAITESLHLDNK